MAITQQEANGAKPYLEAEEVTETCSVQWTIPNWKEVRIHKDTVNGQQVTFESSQHGKWAIGLKAVPCSNGHLARVYWKLVEIYGNAKQLDVTVCTHLLDAQRKNKTSDEKKKMLRLNEIIEESSEYLDVMTTKDVDKECIHGDGSVKYLLKIITKFPASNKCQLRTNEFSRKSLKKLCENQASLLTNDDNADVNFVTRDGTVLPAHKTILMAQCPVFAGMLGTEFREGTSGVVKLDDISGKTMNILLHYFYTGNLLPNWSDDDTILEFVYAVGKYQMNLVLELLDNTLGMDHQRETCFVDVQLLNLTDKLSMKGAEGRLLQRVVEKVKIVKESKDLFELFGYDDEDIAKMANVMTAKNIGESNILEIMDTLLGDQENNEKEKGRGKMGLQVLAMVHRKNPNLKVKNLEKLLLNRYGEIVATFRSAKEMFNFLGAILNNSGFLVHRHPTYYFRLGYLRSRHQVKFRQTAKLIYAFMTKYVLGKRGNV